MAEVTYVSGEFSLVGDWTEEMITDVNIIRKSFVYDFYNENSDIDELSLDNTPSFQINSRGGYNNYLESKRFYSNTTKEAHDRLCTTLKGRNDTYIHISFSETFGYDDDTDEPYSLSHEAKICLYEKEDGSAYLQGEMFDIEEYYEKGKKAFDDVIDAKQYCPKCNEVIGYNCECVICLECGEIICECPKCPNCEKNEIYCECGYDWEGQ